MKKSYFVEGMIVLTEREKEVCKLICEGCINREIAELLYISINTVRMHVHNILFKYSLSNRKELIVLIYKGKIKK